RIHLTRRIPSDVCQWLNHCPSVSNDGLHHTLDALSGDSNSLSALDGIHVVRKSEHEKLAIDSITAATRSFSNVTRAVAPRRSGRQGWVRESKSVVVGAILRTVVAALVITFARSARNRISGIDDIASCRSAGSGNSASGSAARGSTSSGRAAS